MMGMMKLLKKSLISFRSSRPHFDFALGLELLLQSYFIKQSHQQAVNVIINLQGEGCLCWMMLNFFEELLRRTRQRWRVSHHRHVLNPTSTESPANERFMTPRSWVWSLCSCRVSPWLFGLFLLFIGFKAWYTSSAVVLLLFLCSWRGAQTGSHVY